MSFDNENVMKDVQSVQTSATELRSGQIFYGWWVVLASAIGLFWGVPISVYSFTVFLKPLMQEFHAGHAAVSLAFTLHLFAGAISAPLVKWLIDRYGSRQVILLGTVAFGLILLSNRAFATSIRQLYLYYALLGVALHGVGPIPYGSVVCHWFDRRRGLALGLTMVGIGSGAVTMPSLAQKLIARFGWSNAYAILGCAVLLVALPVVAAFLKERPQDLGIVADGVLLKNAEVIPADSDEGLSAGQVWRTRTFWLMVCAFLLVSASVQGCLVHLAAMFNDRGMTFQRAALASCLRLGKLPIRGRNLGSAGEHPWNTLSSCSNAAKREAVTAVPPLRTAFRLPA